MGRIREDKDGNPVAVKIHRVATGDYKAMLKYIEGDRRFKGLKKNTRSIVYTWVRKEFKNLQRARECNVRVPAPVAFKNNVLVMEFIGDKGRPAVMLKDWEMREPARMFEMILGYIKKLYCDGNLVHADMSEYNVLVLNNEPVLIDLSQAVIREHPSSEEFLKRDVANLVRFFGKYIELEEEEVLKNIEDC
jgi:RIO kinase 1